MLPAGVIFPYNTVTCRIQPNIDVVPAYPLTRLPAYPLPRFPAYFSHAPPSTTMIDPVIQSAAGLAR
jgi:hypothetical protein